MPAELKILSESMGEDDMLTLTVETPRCVVCHKGGVMTVNKRGYAAWQRATKIQFALPELSADQREQLMTGTHPKCFEEIFSEEEK